MRAVGTETAGYEDTLRAVGDEFRGKILAEAANTSRLSQEVAGKVGAYVFLTPNQNLERIFF